MFAGVFHHSFAEWVLFVCSFDGIFGGVFARDVSRFSVGSWVIFLYFYWAYVWAKKITIPKFRQLRNSAHCRLFCVFCSSYFRSLFFVNREFSGFFCSVFFRAFCFPLADSALSKATVAPSPSALPRPRGLRHAACAHLGDGGSAGRALGAEGPSDGLDPSVGWLVSSLVGWLVG